MPSFGNDSPAVTLSYGDGPAMRLRDLIYGLHSPESEASEVVARLDPAIMDELHAIVAHRQGTLADFVAHALMELAMEAADAVWRAAVEQRQGPRRDAEAAELGHILVKAMRRHLQAEVALACGDTVVEMTFRQFRVGHPYVSE